MIHRSFGLFAAIAVATPAAATVDHEAVVQGAIGARLARAKAIIERVDQSMASPETTPDGVDKAKLAWTVQGGTWKNWLNWNNLINRR